MCEKKHIEHLNKLDACIESVEFAEQFATLQQAWDHCERGDWLLWYCGKMAGPSGSASRRSLTLAACQCARISLDHIEDPRAEIAIVTAEQWTAGDTTIGVVDVREAAYAAYNASHNVAHATTGAAYYAAAAAANAAYIADKASHAVSTACRASFAASHAASAISHAASAIYNSKREEVLKQCADIVRMFYPTPPKRGTKMKVQG
jgi:hypothetical protein